MSNKKPVKPLVISLIRDQQYDAFGDAANAVVLQKRASWSGNSAEIKHLGISSAVGDLLVIAGGTDSSYEGFFAQLEELRPAIEKALKADVPTLIIGTALRAMIDLGLLKNHKYEPAKHIADDQSIEASEGLGLVTGFVNSRWNYSFGSFAIEGNLVLTQFLGPVLARNPKLADWMLEKAGLQITQNEGTSQVDELAQKVVNRILNV